MSTECESQGYPCYDFHAHVHAHGGKTTCNREHAHLHPGVTGPPQPKDGSHVHDIRGVTTFDFGHTHGYFSMTGPAIQLPGGYHTHSVSFETNEVDGHRHRIMGFVDPSQH
ncbi:MAG TPA: hypothetical protein GXX21_06630 [Syntrophomonadaceae bacterium]|nr:hypothetical protein [Syntrophomonadaceae bacterium]HHW29211.1 hypothetical protein [Syntrophomonadaceae bacterium]